MNGPTHDERRRLTALDYAMKQSLSESSLPIALETVLQRAREFDAFLQGSPEAVSGEAPAPFDDDFMRAVGLERIRQQELGYDAEHDDAHGVQHLLNIAQSYVRDAGDRVKCFAVLTAAGEVAQRQQARLKSDLLARLMLPVGARVIVTSDHPQPSMRGLVATVREVSHDLWGDSEHAPLACGTPGYYMLEYDKGFAPDRVGHVWHAFVAPLDSRVAQNELERHSLRGEVEIGGQRMTFAQFSAARRPIEEEIARKRERIVEEAARMLWQRLRAQARGNGIWSDSWADCPEHVRAAYRRDVARELETLRAEGL